MFDMEVYSVPSSDGITALSCVKWIPDGKVVATLQISHGMIEHIRRYGEFASRMAQEGIAVFGHDHLGHGETASGEEGFGFFAERDGNICVIKDLHRIHRRILLEYPDVPHFMLGHSMGSFFVRRFLTLYGSQLEGTIIMGSGSQPLPLIVSGKILASAIGRWKGRRYRSEWMHRLVLGAYNRRYEPVCTKHDWLSRDSEKVLEYSRDPYCSFQFTCSAYRDFFNLLLDLKLKRQFARIPCTLPVFLLSGAEDPVGDFGKGVRKIYRQFKQLGLSDVEMKLYREDRHELLNEVDRQEVYQDIAHWLCSHMGKR